MKTLLSLLLLAGVITPSLFASDKALPVAWDWPTNQCPADYLQFAHTTALTANPDPNTWEIIRTIPGYTTAPPAPTNGVLNLTFQSGTNWYAVYWLDSSKTFTTNQIVPVLTTTFTITPSTDDFFACRSSNIWGGAGPFGNVAGVKGTPSAVLFHLK